MRHLVNARLGPKATAAARGETSAPTNTALAAFSMNQNSALCLPLVTESQKLVWVHSNQINSQLDGAGELLKAFDRSPYLTKKETAALAQRCSLPPDQVKVWFMVHRLRYGISWDYEDIREVQRKLNSSQTKARGERGPQSKVVKGRIRKKTKTREAEECDGTKEGKARRPPVANKRGMMDKSLLVRKMEQERLKNKEKERRAEAHRGNTGKKWKRMETTYSTVGNDKVAQGGDGTMEGEVRREDQVEGEGPNSIQSDTTNKIVYVNVFPAEQCITVSDELFTQLQLHEDQIEVVERAEVVPLVATDVSAGFEGAPATETWKEGGVCSEFVTDVDKLRELLSSPAVNTSFNLNPQQASQTDTSIIHNRIKNESRFKTKSYSQLKMMRAAFRHCQYPSSEDFDYLTPAIDLPRRSLVKWFSDMRYYVKKRKPTWVNEMQYKQMLSNIRYWQDLEISEGRTSTNRKKLSVRQQAQKRDGSTAV